VSASEADPMPHPDEYSRDALGRQGTTDWHAYQTARARFLARLAEQSAQFCARGLLERLGRELEASHPEAGQNGQ
jgi:hypothetical protein